MSKCYLAFDIGCIECGEDSTPLGLFKTQDEADVVAERASEEQHKNWHGQHRFVVYEVTVP